ncbi:MAG: BlaI/MecI/CopY family transcriptional regulator [Saprospiraceae bacterium]|nr:BlaI/MecI/CopY family transcriptional regulator [Saprospiraceae bacterium]MBP7699491.1 BlaI/MecI/CopY family transcriptional regulator [Saprospiraceae bacterium]
MIKLTKLEEEIMHYIWELERCTVSDIIQQMPEPKPPHSSVSTIVRILEKKEFVSHKAYGKTYEYFALVSKSSYSKKSLKSFIRDYFDGSPQRLVSFLVNEKELNIKELEKLLKKNK